MHKNITNRITRYHQPLCIIIAITTFLSSRSFAQTDEYLKGYTACINHELAPNETIDIYLENKNLNLVVRNTEIDPLTKSNLQERLTKTTLFDHITICSDQTNNDHKSAPRWRPVKMHESEPTLKILPAGSLYDSPIADPKWPRFSAGYQKHLKNS